MFNLTVGQLPPFSFRSADELARFAEDICDLDPKFTLDRIRQMKKDVPEVIMGEDIYVIEKADNK